MFQFLSTAGPLVWLIMLLSVVMWWLILRVYYRQQVFFRENQQTLVGFRQTTITCDHWQQARLREAWLNQAEQSLNQGLIWIRGLIQSLPLLGLLGTVNGMITCFGQLGQDDIQQQLSGGISQAMLTTLAGLVTSLSGLYLAHYLKQRTQRRLIHLKTYLEHPENHAL